MLNEEFKGQIEDFKGRNEGFKGAKSLAVSKIQSSIVVVVSEEPWWEVRGAGAGGGPRQGPGLRRRGRLHGVHPAVSTEYTYMEYTVL